MKANPSYATFHLSGMQKKINRAIFYDMGFSISLKQNLVFSFVKSNIFESRKSYLKNLNFRAGFFSGRSLFLLRFYHLKISSTENMYDRIVYVRLYEMSVFRRLGAC